jgi:hypothetical protein
MIVLSNTKRENLTQIIEKLCEVRILHISHALSPKDIYISDISRISHQNVLAMKNTADVTGGNQLLCIFKYLHNGLFLNFYRLTY